MKGAFITIEGCEGAGKSTIVSMLKDYFKQSGINAVFTREPGGTPISEKLRGIILDKNNNEMTPITELLLYAAARRQHVDEVILPNIEKGYIVVCDRFTDSTLAYQAYARGIDAEKVIGLNQLAISPLKIDLTIFLDITPEKAFKRKGGADKNDRLETAGLDFHNKVYLGYTEIAKTQPERFVKIDADRTGDKTIKDVINALKVRGII